MSAPTASRSTLKLPNGWTVWWSPDTPREIFLGSDDSRFYAVVDGSRERHGLWLTFSLNPQSANFHPQYFNRLARALRDAGLVGPDEAPESDRRLTSRGFVPSGRYVPRVVVDGVPFVPAQ